MKDFHIGFRLNFDEIRLEDIEKFVVNYFKMFDRYELKITKASLLSGKIEYLIKLTKELSKANYSIHLPKNMLTSSNDYDLSKDIIFLLLKFNALNLNLVTHIPNTNIENYLQNVLNISYKLPYNCNLLLENIVVNTNNYEYLKNIKDLFWKLNRIEVSNVSMCLDIGHLLFGCFQEGILQSEVLNDLTDMNFLLSKVKQIHIHDFNSNSDHLPLLKGVINIEEISKFINGNKLYVPIIIETSIEDPKIDGKQQVKIIKHFLNE